MDSMKSLITYISDKFLPIETPPVVMTNTYRKSIYVKSDNAINQLQNCLDEISKSSRDLTTEHFCWVLYVESVDITPTILGLLVQVLNVPLYKTPTATVCKWDFVQFSCCTYARQCSPADMRRLVATLARRTIDLCLDECPQFLECLPSIPELESVGLSVLQARFSPLQCEGLGALVQRSGQLERLYLHLTQPQERLLMFRLRHGTMYEGLQPKMLSEVMVTRGQKDAMVGRAEKDIVIRILQSSLRCLISLDLNYMQIDDCDFMVIVEALPTSQLEYLYLYNSDIQRQGILAFAAQLPRIKNLKEVMFSYNPWEKVPEERQDCWEALLKGIRENYSMVKMITTEYEWMPPLVDYYLRLNKAGRRILPTSSNVPLGLWPLILQRAGRRRECDYTFSHCGAVLLLLQSTPMMSFFCSSSSMTNR